MPKYKCMNQTCPEYTIVEDIHSTKITKVDGKAVNRNAYCKGCGSERDVVREEGMTTMIAGTNDQRKRMAKGVKKLQWSVS